MKKIFENGGILAQIPVLLFVLVYFPLGGEKFDSTPVHVDVSFYVLQSLLCVIPIVQHLLFMNKKDGLEKSTQKNIIRVFYIVSFLLTVWNCYRFQ